MDVRPVVVIVGAGFGGLWAARALSRAPVQVILLDRNNYHTFFPLLYQVGAAELEPGDIAYPVRSIFTKLSNLQFVMANVTGVDLAGRTVESEGLTTPYDYLILATGSVPHYLGVPGAAEHAMPLRSLEEAVAVRNRILSAFEQAAREPGRHGHLTFTIVGGGPTGVEFAGALAELIHGPLARDYPNLDFQQVRVVLLEAGDALLPGLPQRLGAYALARLRRKRVEVYLGGRVERVAPDAVHLDGGRLIPTDVLVWTAGVRGDPDVERWGLPTNRRGQVMVLSSLQVGGYPEVYAVGDTAAPVGDDHLLPMVAPVAMQQGAMAAINIRRHMEGKPPLPFRYRDRGMMAVIGRNAGVAHLFGRWSVTGFVAWLLWLSLHLAKLIGFRNRLVVLTSWAWDYLFFERVARLILPRSAGP